METQSKKHTNEVVDLTESNAHKISVSVSNQMTESLFDVMKSLMSNSNIQMTQNIQYFQPKLIQEDSIKLD